MSIQLSRAQSKDYKTILPNPSLVHQWVYQGSLKGPWLLKGSCTDRHPPFHSAWTIAQENCASGILA